MYIYIYLIIYVYVVGATLTHFRLAPRFTGFILTHYGNIAASTIQFQKLLLRPASTLSMALDRSNQIKPAQFEG